MSREKLPRLDGDLLQRCSWAEGLLRANVRYEQITQVTGLTQQSLVVLQQERMLPRRPGEALDLFVVLRQLAALEEDTKAMADALCTLGFDVFGAGALFLVVDALEKRRRAGAPRGVDVKPA